MVRQEKVQEKVWGRHRSDLVVSNSRYRSNNERELELDRDTERSDRDEILKAIFRRCSHR